MRQELDITIATAFWQACFPNFLIFVFLLMKKFFNAIILILLPFLSTILLILSTLQLFWAVLWRFGKNSKSKMADQRWRLFWHYDVIVTWCDVIFPRDVYQKIGVWTYYIFPKFHCDCLNILDGKRVWKD